MTFIKAPVQNENIATSGQTSPWTLLVLACLILGTMILYLPAYYHDFVQYDDNFYVLDNPEVQKGLTWHGFLWAFVDSHISNYHPITLLSHMLDCQLFGLRAGPPHLVNVLLHSINAGLLFLFLRSATGSFWRCALVAALFAWHPLRVESVAWLSERKDLLSGLFFILTIWSYVAHAKGTKENERHFAQQGLGNRFYWIALVFFALGLLSKPMLIMLPLVLCLLDWWPLKRTGFWNLAREKIPFFCLSGLIALITLVAQTAPISAAGSFGLWERLERSVVAYQWYITKLFWPTDLAVLYLRPNSVPLGAFFVALAILSIISAIAFVGRKSRPWVAFGWLWFLIILVPVIGVVPVGLQMTADRYTYLAHIGLFLAVIWPIVDSLSKSPAFWRGLGIAVVAALMIVLVVDNGRQLACWQNTETLMVQALKIDPNNYVAHENLAVYYTNIKNAKAALYHRERARELLPKK